MKLKRQTASDQARHEDKQNDRRERDAMSPSMRRLILSFADGETSDRTWDPNAFTRSKQFA
jgi:hypothetical protein